MPHREYFTSLEVCEPTVVTPQVESTVQAAIPFGRLDNRMHLPFISRSRLALLLLCAGPMSAHAGTVWQCWYDGAEHVACVLSQSAPSAGRDAEHKVALGQASANTRAGRLPPLVRALHDDPGALRGQVIRIPLHREPTDHAVVGELAQDVMCGGRVGCRAVYSERRARDLASATALADAIDPLLRARQ